MHTDRIEIQPIAYYQGPLKDKFAVPRQSGLAEALVGTLSFEPGFRHREALRGLEDFDYIWLIWFFSKHRERPIRPTVRPPRLGGNERLGVFATRSPFRPNGLGLSCVRLLRVEEGDRRGPILHLAGADLVDGTPVYDIKPYVPLADAYPAAKAGFVDERDFNSLNVHLPEISYLKDAALAEQIKEIIALDPRPAYQRREDRSYVFNFNDLRIVFEVNGQTAQVTHVDKISKTFREEDL